MRHIRGITKSKKQIITLADIPTASGYAIDRMTATVYNVLHNVFMYPDDGDETRPRNYRSEIFHSNGTHVEFQFWSGFGVYPHFDVYIEKLWGDARETERDLDLFVELRADEDDIDRLVMLVIANYPLTSMDNPITVIPK